MKIAVEYDYWSYEANPEAGNTVRSVTFDPEEYLSFERNRRTEAQSLHSVFQGSDSISVCYEDLCEDPERVLAELQTFLRLEVIELKTSMKRSNPDSLRSLVTNFDDLKPFFERSGEEWMLDP
ncbi:MAG: hypothetical protein AAGA96_10330 [Verrucomicrobiota bacterium]